MPAILLPDPLATADELNAFLHSAFPGAPRGYVVEEVTDGGVHMRMPIESLQGRPGGTVSGPTMMSLADAAAWLATLSRIGIVPLAVTSNLTINFLAKPELGADLHAEAELLRLGARSSVTDVRITSGEANLLVAQAVVGYSIPS